MVEYLKTHPKAVERMLFGFVVFLGCFAFPIQSVNFPIDALKIYTFLAGYGPVAIGLADVHKCYRVGRTYVSLLGFTVVGLLCRYALEFGEVSNTYNFTPINIVSYLVLIPAATLLAYVLAVWGIKKEEDA